MSVVSWVASKSKNVRLSPTGATKEPLPTVASITSFVMLSSSVCLSATTMMRLRAVLSHPHRTHWVPHLNCGRTVAQRGSRVSSIVPQGEAAEERAKKRAGLLEGIPVLDVHPRGR